MNYKQMPLINSLQEVQEHAQREKTHHHQENDSNTTNSEEISVEEIRSNGQCCISSYQFGSSCDNCMLLSWALMHKLQHCPNLDSSNWKNSLVLNNDTVSGSATQEQLLEPMRGKQICLSYSYVLLRAPIIVHCCRHNTEGSTELRFDTVTSQTH